MEYNWVSEYMKNHKLKINGIRKAFLLFVFVILGIYCQAQSWSWSDMVSWFSNRGYELLAAYAHPTDVRVSHKIISTSSSNIIVEIRFEGNLKYYTCKYEVIRGTYDYNGMPFFKTVRTLREGTYPSSFAAWNLMPTPHPEYYSQTEEFSDLYGENYFEDLSLGKQAAFALFFEFLIYYSD